MTSALERDLELNHGATCSRLSAGQLQRYCNEGYLVFDQPVLEPSRFDALRANFEGLLAALPPGERPEAMDVPHFLHPELLGWALDPAVLALVEPILGPDLALFSTHFICKPAGNGKRVPWHEDSAYWRGQITPMEVCTVWLALDPSTRENGCMMVIPRSHVEGRAGFSDYDDIATEQAVFPTEITKLQRDVSRRQYVELQPNQASLHDARIQHGSEANTSSLRRCGWTLRFASTRCMFDTALFDGAHQVYLAQGVDHAGNVYADPNRSYPEVMHRRAAKQRYRHSH
jgi:Phytanoyl-CoA dioxygenase (PhyH)